VLASGWFSYIYYMVKKKVEVDQHFMEEVLKIERVQNCDVLIPRRIVVGGAGSKDEKIKPNYK